MSIDVEKYPILFSAATLLAYEISKKYYHDTHYVWCTTSFDDFTQPGSSNPRTICNKYLDQSLKGDKHGNEIEKNKANILKGAGIKYKEGIITKKQREMIMATVTEAPFDAFIPVVYLVNTQRVANKLEVVPDTEKANDTSREYVISNLHKNEFTILSFYDILKGVVEFKTEKAGD